MKNSIKISAITSILLAGSLSAQTLEMKSGWNLIGIQDKPLNANSWNINSLANSNTIEEITNITRSYKKGMTRNSLSSLEAGKGYWVKVIC